jgi:hypothetical protein
MSKLIKTQATDMVSDGTEQQKPTLHTSTNSAETARAISWKTTAAKTNRPGAATPVAAREISTRFLSSKTLPAPNPGSTWPRHPSDHHQTRELLSAARAFAMPFSDAAVSCCVSATSLRARGATCFGLASVGVVGVVGVRVG